MVTSYKRNIQNSNIILTKDMTCAGLTQKNLVSGVLHMYNILDIIDKFLVKEQSGRISTLVELANLSSIIGNLIAEGIVKTSSNIFKKNAPHTYPDLITENKNAKNIEIKIALESNKPKGHHPKNGHYLTIRYVLGDKNGKYMVGKNNRGDVVWIWEIRFGQLQEKDFNTSDTKGDSGKTAVINSTGWKKLKVIFEDEKFKPLIKK